MIAILAVALLGAITSDDPEVLDGRCEYPAEMGAAAPSETRAKCDAAVIAAGKGPNDLLIQFVEKKGGPIVGFAGDVDNTGSLAVRRIYLTPGHPTAADRGHCRIFMSPGTTSVSGLTCVGFIGNKATVANFRAFAP